MSVRVNIFVLFFVLPFGLNAQGLNFSSDLQARSRENATVSYEVEFSGLSITSFDRTFINLDHVFIPVTMAIGNQVYGSSVKYETILTAVLSDHSKTMALDAFIVWQNHVGGFEISPQQGCKVIFTKEGVITFGHLLGYESGV